MSPLVVSLVRRAAACLGIILLDALLLHVSGPGPNLSYILILPPSMLAIGAILRPPLADILAVHMSSFFHPGKTRDRPHPSYSTIEALRIRGGYREALEALEFAVLEAPDDPEPWEMMIGTACDLGDADLAREMFGRGLRALRTPGDRERISRLYRIRTGQLHRREAAAPGREVIRS